METHAEEATKAVNSARKKLQHALTQNEPDLAVIETLLEKLRIRSGNLALLYLTSGKPAEDIENRLWVAHVDVNGKYKALLKTFREGAGRKKHVERRKAEKLYVDFIKASQRFHRAYIERLTANFTSIPKVLEIAHKLGKESLTAHVQKPAVGEEVAVLEASCKRCIIRLGDLSRWRETELQLKERNWGPAKGYYNLALTLDPAEGTCFNQLAVIARNVEDHLGAVYYLHRAATVEKPFPTSADNIKVEFDKVFKVRNEETYGLMDRSGDDIVSALEKRFLQFHAWCYVQPYDFVAFQQKATDVLGMIAICFQETKRGGFDHFLQRACLVNMAAEALAKQGMEKPALVKPMSPDKLAREIERNCQSYFLLQRFNLMTFQALLRVLARELGDTVPAGQDVTDLSRLSPVVRRVLPHLRQYSSWFLSQMRALVEVRFKSSRKVLEQVSKTYVQVLNLLKSNIDVFAPSSVLYLLDEDEKTLSFSAYSKQVRDWRYLQADKVSLKPTRQDSGEGKELAEELAETHLRATDLVVDALRLVKHQDDLGINTVPLVLENGVFVEREIPEMELPKPPPSPPRQTWRVRGHAQQSSINGTLDSPSRPLSAAPTPAAVLTPDVEMLEANPVEPPADVSQQAQHRDNSTVTQSALEEPSTTLNSSSIVTGTPAAPVAAPVAAKLTAMDLVRQMQRSSVGSPVSQRSPDSGKKFSQPSLPSVYNTPFAPTASEHAQLSPRLEYAQKRSPSFTTPEVNSSAMFQEQVAQQQREIQLRSSPQLPFQPTPTWSTYGQTPTGLDSLFKKFEQTQDRTPSPFASNHVHTNGRASQTWASTKASPFGVIGQARPQSHGTPPNGQG